MPTYAPCPKCGGNAAELLKYTWWGGVLGPKMFTHVKCQSCGMKYNGKTGHDNTTNILIYSVVVGIVVFVIVFIAVTVFLNLK